MKIYFSSFYFLTNYLYHLSLQANRDCQIEALKEKNQILQNEINEINIDLNKQLNETREQFQQKINDYVKQSVRKIEEMNINLKFSHRWNMKINWNNKLLK